MRVHLGSHLKAVFINVIVNSAIVFHIVSQVHGLCLCSHAEQPNTNLIYIEKWWESWNGSQSFIWIHVKENKTKLYIITLPPGCCFSDPVWACVSIQNLLSQRAEPLFSWSRLTVTAQHWNHGSSVSECFHLHTRLMWINGLNSSTY